MEILIPAAIYTALVSYIIVKLLTALFHHRSGVIKTISIAITGVFACYLAWTLMGFFRNEQGKSFTVGWFGLAYLLAISATVFAVICWVLLLVGNKIQSKLPE